MSHTLVTPHGHGDGSAMGLAAEKRRNKLGYHRTSVACGHCRRRKIRCIPSPGDATGRCINCIRLKKDCSFLPVDQQPAPDMKKKSASSAMVPLKLEPYSPDKIPERTTAAAHWMAADTSPSPSSRPVAVDAPWRVPYPNESPVTAAFPPSYTTAQSNSAPASNSASASAAWSSQLDPATDARTTSADDPWSYPPQPPRSISFGSDSTSQNAYSSMRGYSSHHAGSGSPVYGRKHSGGTTTGSDHLYSSSATTTSTSVDGLVGSGAVYDSPVPLSTGAASYGGWPHAYSYGSKDTAADTYDWSDHSGVVHAASSMYYAR